MTILSTEVPYFKPSIFIYIYLTYVLKLHHYDNVFISFYIYFLDDFVLVDEFLDK
jgi:hypothetical protein